MVSHWPCHRWEQGWSQVETSSQFLSPARCPSPLEGMLPLGEGMGTAAAAGGLLECLPYRHCRRLRGDLEGFPVLLQWVGNQAEMAEAVFQEVHRDSACRAHEGQGWAEKPDGIYLSGHVAMGEIILKCGLMTMVNLPSFPTPLSRKSCNDQPGLA